MYISKYHVCVTQSTDHAYTPNVKLLLWWRLWREEGEDQTVLETIVHFNIYLMEIGTIVTSVCSTSLLLTVGTNPGF